MARSLICLQQIRVKSTCQKSQVKDAIEHVTKRSFQKIKSQSTRSKTVKTTKSPFKLLYRQN